MIYHGYLYPKQSILGGVTAKNDFFFQQEKMLSVKCLQ